MSKPLQFTKEQNVSNSTLSNVATTSKGHFTRLILFFLFLLPAYILFGQTSQTFTTTNTWLCPAGVTTVNVECWAGGGAGGGATGNPAAGGGGAGGSYVKNISIAVTPGVTYTVTVGTGATGTTGNGAAGNDSWFINSSTILAKGGLGGARANSNNQTSAGAAALTSGNAGFTAPFSYYGGAGGTGVAAGVSGGGGGSSAGTGSNGNGAVGITGGLAVTGGGAGVDGSALSADGADNTNLGGGGAGAHAGSGTNMYGGNGGDGQVKLTYTQPSCPISTAVTPSATQTVCAGFSANLLTAAITLSGTSGTPTLLYQWYYNTTNSNTVAGATLIGGATSATYTPPTITAGTRYYFCVGYATNNSCAETNATQSLASNTVQVTVNASLSGNYLVGTGQAYTTLTAAVAAYNSSCLSGPVTFLLTNNGGTYTAGETFPITINANTYASSTNTLTIKPNTGVTTTISGTLSNNALIRILGNYVIIDGSNNGSASRNLTMTNANTTGPSVVLIGSTGTTPISGVTLKNSTVINGVQTATAIVISDAGTLGNAGYFNDIIIQNNSVQKAYMGIYAIAVNVGVNGNGLDINSNDLTTSGTNAIRLVGIYVQDIFGATVSNNTIGNFETASTEFDYGIWFASGTKNSEISGNTISNLAYTGASNTGPNGIFISTNTYNSFLTIINNTITGISSTGWVPVGGAGAASGINIDFASAGGDIYGNKISNIKNTNASGYGCNGIQLSATATDANFNVYNNFIWDVASAGSTSTRGHDRNGHGIAVTTGGGYHIYNNTVLLNTNQANSGYPSAINIASAVTTPASINLKNNILINAQTQTGDRYAIESGAANTVFASIDYNDYYTTGTNLGYIGSNRNNLAAVQTGFGSNTNSLNILPVFVSATDLHIQTSPVVNEPLNNSGIPVTGISGDIDVQTRNIFTPDMGADEFKGRGSWIGVSSSDWTNPTNWFDNFIPLTTTHIEIGTATFMPVISSTTQPGKNIVIEAPGTLTVSGTGILQIAGRMSNTGTFNASGGTIEMNAAIAQTIPAGIFQNNNVKNLIINNTNVATGVTLAGTLDIYRSLTFGSSGLKLTTGGFLTFKSTSTETAWLGDMTGKTITGTATVERYIPNHAKAWQFLAVPTTGQTVNAAWQEGNAPLVVGTSGLGTIITNNVAGAGFDIISGNSPSIKSFDTTSRTWTGIANTGVLIDNQRGYMLFVRGDRSVQNTSTPATATNLRTKGTLYTPANPPSVVNMAANTFQSVGNPYPSAIDLTLLTRTGGVQDLFYVWDPKLTTSPAAYGLGAYQTFTRSGATYNVTPGGGSYLSGTSKTIESGQAFFIRALSTTGSLSFSEACKSSGSNLVTRVPMAVNKQLRTNLKVISGENLVLIDGTLVQYDASYSNNIDMQDAVKLGNTGENLGLLRNGNSLVVESRAAIQLTDTVFYKLGQMRVQQYQFEFVPTNMEQPGLAAFLEDKYLQTSTPVDFKQTTRIMFNVVNIPGSYATDRFRLVFRQVKQPLTVPVTCIDAKGNSGNAVETSGKIPDQIMTVIKKATGITVYPNPVVDKTMQIKFTNQPVGIYSLQLTNRSGQLIYTCNIELNNSDMIRSIKLSETVVAGSYQLNIISTEGIKTTQQIIIL